MQLNNRKSLTSSLSFWFGMLVLVGPLHMTEQLFFGLQEMDELKALLAGYYSNFANPNIGTWWLVVGVVTFLQVLIWGMLAGGRLRLAAAAFFGAFSVFELHHVFRSAASGGYNPGVVTSVAFAWIGWMLLRSVRQEWGALKEPAVQECALLANAIRA
jgi:hypothetical protein